MTFTHALSWLTFALAALPLGLTVWNVFLLRRLPRNRSDLTVSVLIPARDEERNIGAAIESAVSDRSADIEILVLDDDSTDATPRIVNEWAARDSRVRLITGAHHDPSRWGKPQACAVLADAATAEILLFMDADVRLAPGAIGRIAAAFDSADHAMLSGVPAQKTEGLAEKIVVPLIQFILLGFLPLAEMRSSRRAGFGVACGQLLAVRRDAYRRTGGHRAIADKVHDGMALARAMREAGYMTDLADFSDLAVCRMYRSTGDVIAGFAKNAHEGLGSPGGILPWTLLLAGGQCLWLGLLPFAATGAAPVLPLALAGLSAYSTRVLLDVRFRQSPLGTAMHPFGVLALVLIQWYALVRRLIGRPVAWKNRFRQKREPGRESVVGP